MTVQMKLQRERQWLDSLKEGDQVVVSSGGFRSTHKLETVERTTSTLIIIGRSKYRRANGRLSGGTFGSSSIMEPTDELRAEIEQQERRDAATSIIFKTGLDNYNTIRAMSLDRLERIAEACKEPVESDSSEAPDDH